MHDCKHNWEFTNPFYLFCVDFLVWVVPTKRMSILIMQKGNAYESEQKFSPVLK